jgi:hypothetical protein
MTLLCCLMLSRGAAAQNAISLGGFQLLTDDECPEGERCTLGQVFPGRGPFTFTFRTNNGTIDLELDGDLFARLDYPGGTPSFSRARVYQDHRFGLYALLAQQAVRNTFRHFFCRDSRGAFHYLGLFANLSYDAESGLFEEVELLSPADAGLAFPDGDPPEYDRAFALRGCRFVTVSEPSAGSAAGP